jgi:3-hydroxybutyryl-CoA dehydrogenase
LEQADLGGTDLTIAIHELLMPDIDATPVPHPYLQAMVDRGDLGAKSGRGFYSWAPGEADLRRQEINQGLIDQLRRDVTVDVVSARNEVDGSAEE